MESIKQTFFLECEEQLSELEAGLLAIEERREEPDTINAVFRAVHSIKGGAGAFKLNDLVQFSHAFETALDRMRSNQLASSMHVIKIMLRAADVLSDLVVAARESKPLPASAWKELTGELLDLTDEPRDASPVESTEAPVASDAGAETISGFTPMQMIFDDLPEPPPAVAIVNIEFQPTPELYAKANDVVPILRELERLGTLTATCDVGSVPFLEDFDPAGAYLSWAIVLETLSDEATVREAFEFVDGDCTLSIKFAAAPEADAFQVEPSNDDAALNAPISVEPVSVEPVFAPSQSLMEPEPASASAVSVAAASPAKADRQEGAFAQANQSQPTIRVDFERVDRLINLVGELVITQAMLSQRVIEAGVANSPSVVVGLDELEQLTREIQESVMAIRAQPVRPLFQRMSRIAREVADATGKQVRLKTEGDATEIDKTVVERLADPLTHMIRNAIDHGVESPEVRLAAGKPAEGVVRLNAGHKSGRVVIEVADDGAGIDRTRVKAIAVKKGLIPAELQLSDSEIDNLLFLPGFSTASSVSSISGRGVGMDVVKRSIQALGGRISIASRPGIGSTFTMSLPLTLAVLDGMVVAVNNQTFVVPLTAIIETIKPSATCVHLLGANSRVIAIRGNFLPVIDVGSELGIRPALTDAHNGVAILVETEGGAHTALLVDSIQDQRQVVIKSLEANYGPTPCVAAATILGDGRVALILDVEALVSGRPAVTRGELEKANGG